MDIHPGIKLIDLGLYLVDYKTLVLADFHLGYEEALNRQGVLIPRFQFKNIILKLDQILSQAKNVETIVINGDIKHEFGLVSQQEWRETLKLIDYLKQRCKKIILLRGNHDTLIGPIADKRKVEIRNSLQLGDITILHGHKRHSNPTKIVIIGHEHPAISLHEGSRVEKFKAFLKGKISQNGKNFTLIVQPSFNLVVDGTDILKEKTISSYLQGNLANFHAFIVADRIYNFGRLKGFEQ